MKSTFVAYDPAAPPTGDPDLLFPNTTTLVDVILNRTQTDKLAVITGPGRYRGRHGRDGSGAASGKDRTGGTVSPDRSGVVGV